MTRICHVIVKGKGTQGANMHQQVSMSYGSLESTKLIWNSDLEIKKLDWNNDLGIEKITWNSNLGIGN